MLTEYSEALAGEEAERLIQRLSARKSEWPSEMSLQNLNPRTVDALITRFADAERNFQPAAWIEEVFSALLLLTSAAIVVFNPLFPLWLKAISILCVAIPSLYGLWQSWRGLWTLIQGKWAYIVYALTQTEEVRVLETLIVATHYKWGRHPEVLKTINRLLEQVTEADAGLLSDRAQQRLWTIGIAQQTLSESYDPTVAINALRALAAMGNHATYTRMEQYASRQPNLFDERPVIAAARDLLPLMLERFRREQGHQTLLRAANVTDIQNHMLLRTVQSPVSEPPHELLRLPAAESPDPNA